MRNAGPAGVAAAAEPGARLRVSQRRTFALTGAMFLGVLVVIVALAIGALTLTNLIRAYSTGEGLYAKGQKQALYALERYADTGDPAYYDVFLQRMRIPLGDRRARIAMESEPPDREAAREGLLAGRNDPADVPGMITVFLLAHDTPLFREPVALWREADSLLLAMLRHAESLRAALQSTDVDRERVSVVLEDIYALDQQITRLQDEFSRLLGDIARQIDVAAAVLLVLAALLLSLGTIAFGARLQRRSLAAEAALAQREYRLRALMNSTADGLLSVLPGGRIEAANEAAAQILRCRPRDLAGRAVGEFVAEENRAEFAAAMERAFAGEPQGIAGRELVFDGCRQDGCGFPMEVAFTIPQGLDERLLIVTLRDITERLATEARLFQAQKMEAVGQLTGGVAHDINNLLTVITGNLELLRDELGKPGAGDAKACIDAALSAADRGARVTSYMLAFSRRQPLAPSPVDIDALFAVMRGLRAQTVSGAIDSDYRLDARGWRAMVDPTQLEAALLNLVLNARHATGDGGRIVIASSPRSVDEAEAGQLELEAGDYLRLAVSDNGVDIPAEHLDKVFEPFFTTREVGSGSGLGLSMVQGFVTQSGGQVRLDSAPGRGTTVELYLPRAAGATVAADDQAGPAGAAGRARILLVEDDPSLRDVARRMLRLSGYEVDAVGDAPTALARLAAGATPDLLVSDVVLPAGMDGFALARKAREYRPALAVLMVSGFPRESLDDPDAQRYRLLAKPFTLDQLTEAVADALAEASDA